MTKNDSNTSARIEASIDETAKQLEGLYRFSKEDTAENVPAVHPDIDETIAALKLLADVLLPGRITPAVSEAKFSAFLRDRLSRIAGLLRPQLEAALPYRWLGEAVRSKGSAATAVDAAAEAERVLQAFFQTLPQIRSFLVEDIKAAYRGDPAALTFLEVQLSYPGLLAICSHRIAHELYKLEVPIVPRIMSEWTHTQTGVDINPGARIGQGFFIDHCTGVVIGETTKIGNNVKIYQGATLGAKSFPLDENGLPIKNVQRHPTVEDNVVIYANAVILGGDTIIGNGSTIGGGVCLMESVPPRSLIVEKRPELQIKQSAK